MSYSDNHAVSGVLCGWVGVGWESFSVFCFVVHCPFHLPFCLVTLTHFLLLLISSLPSSPRFPLPAPSRPTTSNTTPYSPPHHIPLPPSLGAITIGMGQSQNNQYMGRMNQFHHIMSNQNQQQNQNNQNNQNIMSSNQGMNQNQIQNQIQGLEGQQYQNQNNMNRNFNPNFSQNVSDPGSNSSTSTTR